MTVNPKEINKILENFYDTEKDAGSILLLKDSIDQLVKEIRMIREEICKLPSKD